MPEISGLQLKTVCMLRDLQDAVLNGKYGVSDDFRVTPFLDDLDDATDFLDEVFEPKLSKHNKQGDPK